MSKRRIAALQIVPTGGTVLQGGRRRTHKPRGATIALAVALLLIGTWALVAALGLLAYWLLEAVLP